MFRYHKRDTPINVIAIRKTSPMIRVDWQLLVGMSLFLAGFCMFFPASVLLFYFLLNY